MTTFLATVPQWISTSFPILERICMAILAILALVLIVLVFLQITGSDESNNVIMGNKESYYSQNKSGNREGRITRLIWIILGVIAFICIVYFILLKVPAWVALS